MDEELELYRLRARAKRKLEQEQLSQQPSQADVSSVTPTPETSPDLAEMIFPESMKMVNDGGYPSTTDLFKNVGADVLTLPNRFLASITGAGEMHDPEANIFGGARQRLRDFLDRGMRSNEEHAELMKQKYKNGHWTDDLDVNDPNKYIFDPRRAGNAKLRALREAGDLMFEIGGDPFVIASTVKGAIKGGGKVLRSAVGASQPISKTVVEAPRKVAGSIAEEVGTVPEEALTMWGTKEGKETLKKAWNQELPTAKEMVEKVYGDLKYLPEEKQVQQIVDKMEPIDLGGVIKSLEKSKTGDAVGVNAKVNREIDGLINQMKQIKGVPKKSTGMGKDGAALIPASRFRDIRKQLDETARKAFNKDYQEGLEKAVEKAGNYMRSELVAKAPAEYKGLMETYADKMQKIDKLKGKLGQDKEKAVERAFSLLRTSENTSRQPTKEIMKEFDDVFGTDFSKRSETMDLARKLGKPGKKELELPLLPKGATGNRWVAIITGGLGFPRLAPNILKTIDKLESFTKGTGKAIKKIGKGVDEVSKVKSIASTINALAPEQKKALDSALDSGDDKTINSILGDK